MELFLEAKNRKYQAVADLLNQLANSSSGAVSGAQLAEFLGQEQYGGFDPALKRMLLADEDNLFPLLWGSEEAYMLTVNAPVPVRPFIHETLWLKRLVDNPRLQAFLAPQTIEKLKRGLAHYDHILDHSHLVVRQTGRSDTDWSALRPILRTVLRAIAQERSVVYDYTPISSANPLRNRRSVPQKVEYDLRSDMLYLLHFDLIEKRPVKSALSRFSRMQLGDIVPDPESIQQMYLSCMAQQRCDDPILLEITDRQNALERAFYLLSSFPQEAEYLRERDVHHLRLYYHAFEEEELISRIFSLGGNVVILEPDNLRKKMVEYLLIMQTNYASETPASSSKENFT